VRLGISESLVRHDKMVLLVRLVQLGPQALRVTRVIVALLVFKDPKGTLVTLDPVETQAQRVTLVSVAHRVNEACKVMKVKKAKRVTLD